MAKEKAKRGLRGGVNPFQKLETPAEIMSAAKSGALASGFLGLSYGIQAGMLYASGSDLFGNSGLVVLASDVLAIAFAAWLTFCTLRRQPLWAAIVTAIWFFFELVAKFSAPGAGEQLAHGGFGFLLMFFALASGAILGVRGAWKLRQGVSVAEVFE
jgi:hypothetical protein